MVKVCPSVGDGDSACTYASHVSSIHSSSYNGTNFLADSYSKEISIFVGPILGVHGGWNKRGSGGIVDTI